MSETKISPSILGTKDEVVVSVVEHLLSAGADYIHYDVMDGKFVANQSFSADHLRMLKSHVPEGKYDVHLMVADVPAEVEKYASLSPEFITFHYEAVDKNKIEEEVNFLHEKGIKAGISVNPDTSVTVLNEYLKLLDLVLVMSVVPGKGGQSFMMNALDKIAYLKKVREEHHYHYVIEVDGGVNASTGKLAAEAGCDVLVAGSYILRSDSYKEKIDSLK